MRNMRLRPHAKVFVANSFSECAKKRSLNKDLYD